MARKRKERESLQGNWLTSYGDMVTLLLCFFVLLYAMSRMDVARFQRVADSMKQSFGTDALPMGSTGRQSGGVVTTEVIDQEQLRQIHEQISLKITEAGLEHAITLEMDEEGLLVRMSTDEVLFDLGKTDLKPVAIGFLDSLGTMLVPVANHITVEGHTDNLPISNTRFPTNWELSTARASAVIRFFIERHHMDPARLRASGYADMRPRFPNDTEDHRYCNRRVEVLIKPVMTTKVEPVDEYGEKIKDKPDSKSSGKTDGKDSKSSSKDTGSTKEKSGSNGSEKSDGKQSPAKKTQAK